MPASDDERPAHVPATGFRSHAYYLPSVLHERLKAAWWATKEEEPPDGAPSLSTKVAQLFEDEASRLEQRYNGGEPFAPAPKNARGVDPVAARRQGEVMKDVWAAHRSEHESHE